MNKPVRGLSLIETVVTVSLLAITLLVIIDIIPGAYVLQSRARFRVAAHQLARSLLEEKRARPFSDLVVGPAVKMSDKVIEGTSTVLHPSLTVSPLPGHSQTDLLLLHLDVEWEYRGKSERIVHELRLYNTPR